MGTLLELLPTVGLEAPVFAGGAANPKAGLPAALDSYGMASRTILPSYMALSSTDKNGARIIPGSRIIETNNQALIDALRTDRFRLLSEGMLTMSRPLGGSPCATRVASLCFCPQEEKEVELTGAKPEQTAITRHIAIRVCGGIRLIYGNWSKNGETKPANAIKVRAGLEASEKQGTAERVVYKVTFNGQEQVTIAPGAYVISDIIPEDFAAGQAFFVRTNVSVETEKQKIPVDLITVAANGEGVQSSVQKAYGETIAPSNTACYSPVGIVATAPTSTVDRIIAMITDSIGAGQTGSGEDAGGGWLLRWLNNEYGYMKLSKGGETAAKFASEISSQARMKLADACTHAVVAYGTNDFGEGKTAAETKASLTRIYERLQRRGITVIGVTVPPKPTSTDAFATLGNQTVPSWETERKELNAWVKSKQPGVASVIDLASAVESSPESGKWKVGFTSEGTHPIEAGHAAIAAAAPATLLTLV